MLAPAPASWQWRAYTLAEITKWLRVFLARFFASSQFIRSAMPNGPKAVAGRSLSPRSDWRAPSDASADSWLAELDANVPDNGEPGNAR
jgi:NAD+ synthase (glutamine-hydrolysing)